MRTITLELLRHGPPNNQLLSPLTPYLALCENHAAVTIYVPFEHNQFLHRLSGLRYEAGDNARLFELTDTAKIIGELLGGIPGLTAESNKSDQSTNSLTHLRLIISASELALLPFELSLAPNGVPGAGQHLLLQPQMPICLTREIRRVPGEQLQWPKKPRILFVAAAPPGVGDIPLQSHLLTLRKLIAPWVKYYDKNNPDMQREKLEEHFVFLPEATIERIERACATNSFTHVHILAHGIKREENFNSRFYLALHNEQDPSKPEYISGHRLATALRPSKRPDSDSLAKPVVVTLASCDSGNVGSVAGAGASIAHALHESGIPMVVASQFPLSFQGSVRLVECLYEGLLWGVDPRRLLYDLRRRLYAQMESTHDWASLTTYASLPADIDQQLSDVQIEQARHSIEAALNYTDEITRQLSSDWKEMNFSPSDDKKQSMSAEANDAEERIENAKARLNRLLERIPDKNIDIFSLLASTEKRQAQIRFTMNGEGTNDQVFTLLSQARDHYWEAYMLKRNNAWLLVQYISLTIVLHHMDINARKRVVGNNDWESINDLWFLTLELSRIDLRSKKQQEVTWAYGNLIEIWLLSLLLPDKKKSSATNEEAEEQAVGCVHALLHSAGRNSFEVYSTRRQIARYIHWYPELIESSQVSVAHVGAVRQLAYRIVSLFPQGTEES
ncbi:hypothetical protein GCM10023187_55240 [Nibrella viscosa]|uniref:CHAT domain-containing protein n=2 Tax=Nibrella viscosa TaxID=1084524 RepID=A0ABP8L078_9BACT